MLFPLGEGRVRFGVAFGMIGLQTLSAIDRQLSAAESSICSIQYAYCELVCVSTRIISISVLYFASVVQYWCGVFVCPRPVELYRPPCRMTVEAS